MNDEYNMNKIDETLFVEEDSRRVEEIKESMITLATAKTTADLTLPYSSVLEDKKEEDIATVVENPTGKLECCRFCL